MSTRTIYFVRGSAPNGASMRFGPYGSFEQARRQVNKLHARGDRSARIERATISRSDAAHHGID